MDAEHILCMFNKNKNGAQQIGTGHSLFILWSNYLHTKNGRNQCREPPTWKIWRIDDWAIPTQHLHLHPTQYTAYTPVPRAMENFHLHDTLSAEDFDPSMAHLLIQHQIENCCAHSNGLFAWYENGWMIGRNRVAIDRISIGTIKPVTCTFVARTWFIHSTPSYDSTSNVKRPIGYNICEKYLTQSQATQRH